MLQNRVDPSGEIIFTPERGAWMGNRGVIHNKNKVVVRQFKIKTWITCALQFKGRHREVMSNGRYTELFFLDEATAFSAGHRPCAECRRADYNRLGEYWLKGNEDRGLTIKTTIDKIDEIIHAERIGKDHEKLTHKEPIETLPDGSFILLGEITYLKFDGKLFKWSPAGYSSPEPINLEGVVDVLTPKSIVNTFRAGYVPQVAI